MAAPAFLQDAFKPGFAKDLFFKMLPKKVESELLGKSGSLEVRLARSPKDIKRAQKLRYRVFFQRNVGHSGFCQPFETARHGSL